MAKPTSLSLTGNGSSVQNSAAIALNPHISPFKTTIRLNTDGSTTTGTVQYTLDDPWGDYPTDFATDADWVNDGTLASLTADTTGAIDFPVTAVRLQVGATGTDSWTMTVLQAGIRGN